MPILFAESLSVLSVTTFKNAQLAIAAATFVYHLWIDKYVNVLMIQALEYFDPDIHIKLNFLILSGMFAVCQFMRNSTGQT